jgi:hypothetical protein
MDIVFRPDGNFDEVYLYVRSPSPSPRARLTRRRKS